METGESNLGRKTRLLWQDPEYREHMRQAHLGQVAWNKGKKTGLVPRTAFKPGCVSLRKGTHLSEETKRKLSLKLRGRIMLSTRGEKNWNWKGGTSRSEDKKIRQSIEYKTWRRAVFERDDFTCQLCHHRGKTIHADHIRPFCKFPDLRFDLDNGRTLCIECHLKTPTYGGRKK